MFHFTDFFIIQNYIIITIVPEFRFFVLEARSNSKITLTKTKCVVNPLYHGNNNGVVTMVIVGKDESKVYWKQMLETIIAEATFFSIWIFFHKHSQFTGQHGKGETISLTPYEGQTFLGEEFMWRLF